MTISPFMQFPVGDLSGFRHSVQVSLWIWVAIIPFLNTAVLGLILLFELYPKTRIVLPGAHPSSHIYSFQVKQSWFHHLLAICPRLHTAAILVSIVRPKGGIYSNNGTGLRDCELSNWACFPQHWLL